jgi:HEAT repeat
VPHTSSHTYAAAAAAVDSAAGEQQPAVKRRRLSFEHSAAAAGATTAGAGSEQRQQQLSDSTLCAREHMQSGLSEEAGGLARGYTGAQAVCTLLEELSGCALNAVAFLRALDSAAADSSGDAAAALSQEVLLLERTAALTHAIRALLPHYDARTSSSSSNNSSSSSDSGGNGVRELPSQAAGSATAATTAGPALPDMLQCLLSGYEAAARVVAQRSAPQSGQRATLWLWSMLVDAGIAWLHWAGAVPCVLTAVRAVALAATAAALQRSALSLDDGAAVLDRAFALSAGTATACESRSSARSSGSSNSRQRSEAAAAAASLASLVDERLLQLSMGSADAALGSPARSRQSSAARADSSVYAVLDAAHERPLLQRCLILLSCCGESSRPAAAVQDSSGSSSSASDATTASSTVLSALTHSSAQVRGCAVTALPVLLETLASTAAATATTAGAAAADSTAQAQQQQLKLALDALQWTQQWEPALQQLLQDSNTQVRKLCAAALGQLACVAELTYVLAATAAAASSSTGSSSSSSAHLGLRLVPLACALGESEEVAVTAGSAAVLNRANSALVLGPLMTACTRDAAPEVWLRVRILCFIQRSLRTVCTQHSQRHIS